jgi:hypothetical protein
MSKPPMTPQKITKIANQPERTPRNQKPTSMVGAPDAGEQKSTGHSNQGGADFTQNPPLSTG